jgi:hypothetical protein
MLVNDWGMELVPLLGGQLVQGLEFPKGMG